MTQTDPPDEYPGRAEAMELAKSRLSSIDPATWVKDTPAGLAYHVIMDAYPVIVDAVSVGLRAELAGVTAERDAAIQRADVHFGLLDEVATRAEAAEAALVDARTELEQLRAKLPRRAVEIDGNSI